MAVPVPEGRHRRRWRMRPGELACRSPEALISSAYFAASARTYSVKAARPR
jgi:hypothetical protein